MGKSNYALNAPERILAAARRAAKRDGAEGVGIATNRAIVHGAVVCIVLNLVMSWLLYG